MRKKLIAGNWKMNGLLQDGSELAKGIAAEVKKLGKTNLEFLVCPPFTILSAVKKSLRGAKVALGAQDCSFHEKGTHTGDISPLMLTDLGCKYVIVGHSERRADHQESNELVEKKAIKAIESGLIPIICIGETRDQRAAGQTIEICTNQILGSVPTISTAKNTVLAYEPIWAISAGTGPVETPTAEEIQKTHAALRNILSKKLGKSVANGMRILYGGSVNPKNAKEFLSLPDVDGGLIGGASLKVETFVGVAIEYTKE